MLFVNHFVTPPPSVWPLDQNKMINLLTPETQAAVLVEYRSRRRVVGGCLALGVLLSALALGGTLLSQLRLQQLALKDDLGKLATANSNDELKNTLQQTGAEIALLRTTSNERPLVALWRLMLAHRPSQLMLDGWTSEAATINTAATIKLSGQAPDRQTLLNFLDALRREPTFSAVDSPITNLIKSRDIPFNIQLTLAKS